MRILDREHRINGNEYVRQIIPLNCFGQTSDNFALSTLLLYWYPVKHIFGSCWKGKKIKTADKYNMYEFCSIEENEYFPNVQRILQAGPLDALITWKNKGFLSL